jgi:prephenate dehydratase
MIKPLMIGVSGEKGSFSEEAGLLYAKKNQLQPLISYLIDMKNVLAAVEAGEVDIGVFPVINLRGGLVKMAFEAMGKHLFKPIDELWLDVHQCLLVKPGVFLHQIKNVVSHPQAIAQCQQFLQKTLPDVLIKEWQDTAKAAKDLFSGEISADSAVIAPARSAELYQLDILAKNIQDQQPNLTGFIIATKDES